MGHPGFCGCSEKSEICGCLENSLVSFWELTLVSCIAQKRRGDLSFEISPLLSDFEDPVRFPDHNYSSLQICSRPASGARCFPYFSVITFAVRAFLCHPSAASFPGAARVSSDRLALTVARRLPSLVSDPHPILASDPLPISVAGSLPSFVSDSLPDCLLRFPLRVALPVLLEFLPRTSCELRFRSS